jgi:hypothetical protein
MVMLVTAFTVELAVRWRRSAMKLEWMPMFWLAFTLLAYLFSRWIYRRTGRYLLSPLILVPLLLALAVPLHTAYAEYASNTHWLMLVLGPVTVAFAVPIWQQRRCWRGIGRRCCWACSPAARRRSPPRSAWPGRWRWTVR